MNVFLVWLPNFTLNHLLLFWWLQSLQVHSYISYSTFVASPYINSCILVSFLLTFAWHVCPLVSAHLSLCMFSGFFFKSYILPICCKVSVCMYPLILYDCHNFMFTCVCTTCLSICCAKTLSCLITHSFFAKMRHPEVRWSIVSSYCSYNQHLLSISSFKILFLR